LEEEKLASETSNNDINEENHVCMFCGREPAITKQQAELNGVNWNEYCAHPNKLKTCWPCIEGSISVISEKATLLKFNKKLSTMKMSNTGFEYNPFFTFLKSKVTCFHQTIHNKEITYFWFPDLEMEALSLGWRRRAQKKQQGVPWVQKDLSSKREAATLKSLPSKLTKRKKPVETDDTIDSMETSESTRKRHGRGEKTCIVQMKMMMKCMIVMWNSGSKMSHSKPL
jgi:hypothetical protein